MLRPLGNMAAIVPGMPLMKASLPRIGAMPGSRPIISNSKLSASKSPRNFVSGFSRVTRNVRAFSFCCSRFMACSSALSQRRNQGVKSTSNDEHRAARMAQHLFRGAADHHPVPAGATVGGHHNQIDALLARVFADLDGRRSDDGCGDNFLRVLEVGLLDAKEFFLRLFDHRR